MRFLFFSILFYGLSSLASTAIPNQRIPIEHLFYSNETIALKLSPGGDCISYLSASEEGHQELCLEFLDAPSKKQSISHAAPTHRVNVYFWLSDTLMVWEEQELKSAEKRWFTYDFKSQSTRRILQEEQRHAEIIGITAGNTPSILFGISEQASAFPDVYRFNPISEKLTFVRQNTEKISHWVFSQDGSPLAGLRWTIDGGKEILSFQSRPEIIQRYQVNDSVQIHSATTDGKSLIILSDADSDTLQAYRLDLATKKKTSIYRAQAYDLTQIIFKDQATEPYLLLWHKEKPHYEAQTPEAKAIIQLCNEKFGAGNWEYIESDKEQQKHLISEYSDQEPGKLYLYNTKIHQLQLLWVNNPTIHKDDLLPTQLLHYTAKDGTTIKAYWTTPKGEPPTLR